MKKEDYVTALLDMTSLTADALRSVSVERLKAIYGAMKPVQKKIMPANWKRFNKAELIQLYVERLNPQDRSYLQKNKAELIMELEIYLAAEEEEGSTRPESPEGKMPLCPSCQVPMVERKNRMTEDRFLGCSMFPQCKTTMPMAFMNPQAKGSHGEASENTSKGYKNTFVDGAEDMDGNARARAHRKVEK